MKRSSKRSGTMYGGLARGLVRTRGRMNKTEAKFARMLDEQRLAGEVDHWLFESVTFRLTLPDRETPVRYTPDFMVQYADRVIAYIDVKGKAVTDAALLRIKVAADRFRGFRWVIAKNLGGDKWEHVTIDQE